nr:immunoglobulin heavy chain junction region [Macaca mulatta]MOW33559.1 immunoglobulin heavy chain junction region [Macaca mulatta]
CARHNSHYSGTFQFDFW